MPVKKDILSTILLGVFSTILLLILSCHVSLAIGDNQFDDEVVLTKFLEARSNGFFEECKKFVSVDFLDRFKDEHKTDYVDYFRNKNEDYYKSFKITGKNTREDGVAIINVSTIVEGPGYNSRAIERFLLSKETGVWKIIDWKIEYAMTGPDHIN